MNARRAPRTLPLRRWLALALVASIAVPIMVTGVLVFHLAGVAEDFDETPHAAANLLRADAAHWSDPAWQAATQAELHAQGADFILIEGGRELYRSTADPLAGDENEERQRRVQMLVVPGSEPEQRAYIFADADSGPPERIWLAPVVALATLVVTLVGIAWVLGFMVIRPLAATSAAARQIATGSLDVSLTSSHVREVEEVSEALAAMSAGLQESVRQQAALEEERRTFIGAVAHDLRTPLFTLRGSLEGIQTGLANTPEKQARYIAIAQEKATALERLISDLFDYTRLEYLDLAPDRAPLDLGPLLLQLGEGFRPVADARAVALAFDLPAVTCIVHGDEHLLTRAIVNLVDNALYFTPEGGRITIGCHSVADRVEFSVSDNGPGIPEDDLPHIFSPLFRGETSRNRSTGGAGLGLTIARRILRAHGGELSVGNRAEGGAVFTGWLPSAPTGPRQSVTSHSARIAATPPAGKGD
jgi:signal transduction histidine kinase